jgi:hypothetical protein
MRHAAMSGAPVSYGRSVKAFAEYVDQLAVAYAWPVVL